MAEGREHRSSPTAWALTTAITASVQAGRRYAGLRITGTRADGWEARSSYPTPKSGPYPDPQAHCRGGSCRQPTVLPGAATVSTRLPQPHVPRVRHQVEESPSVRHLHFTPVVKPVVLEQGSARQRTARSQVTPGANAVPSFHVWGTGTALPPDTGQLHDIRGAVPVAAVPWTQHAHSRRRARAARHRSGSAAAAGPAGPAEPKTCMTCTFPGCARPRPPAPARPAAPHRHRLP